MTRARDQGAEALATDPSVVSAPLFRGLVDGLDIEQRQVVLDLGTACPETVHLFGRFRCRMDIADLAAACAALNDADEPDTLERQVDACLPPRREEPTDIVLCWDLLNYLNRRAISALMDRIAMRCRPGARIHVMMFYSNPRMPARPGQIAPLEDGRLRTSPATGESTPAPRYTPEDLAHCLRGYAVERAMLLRNGMQEYMYRLQR